VPAQQRLWRHDQSLASPPREQARERRKQRLIGRPQQGTPLLPTEHGQLMAQHQQFDIFGELAAPAPDQQPQHGREGEIGEREQHATMLSPPLPPAASTNALVPSGSQPVAKSATIW
jgi:hypothetical protein